MLDNTDSTPPTNIPQTGTESVLPGLLRGTVGFLTNQTSLTCSSVAAQIAVSAASSGGDGDPMGFGKKTEEQVVYVNTTDHPLEEREAIRHVFIHTDPDLDADVFDRFICSIMPNQAIDIVDSGTAETVISKCEQARLIVIHSLFRMQCFDQDSPEEMMRLLNQVGLIARRTTATVLLVEPYKKESQIFTDNVEWNATLAREGTHRAAGNNDELSLTRGQELRLSIQRTSYALAHRDIFFYQDDKGIISLT